MKDNSTEPQRTVAIMQPYFLPYIGYFQLICASDVFVFYDDVHFMKKGWLRRNRIWSNSKELMISLPCKGASQNKLINEVEVATEHPDYLKIQKTISQSYAKAEHFNSIDPLLEQIFSLNHCSVADFNVHSLKIILNYLGIDRKILKSSEVSPETKGMQRAQRLIAITKLLGGATYINSPGGTSLYTPDIFHDHGIELEFLKNSIPVYDSGPRKGMPLELSIIDSLFNIAPKKLLEILHNGNSIES
jgi:hypothetical protein